jgi:dsDNA-binding SOS-regulon protein
MHQTIDGKHVFRDKAEADAYDAEVKDATTVDSYLAERDYMKTSTKTRARNSILDFLAWQKNQA